MLAKRVIPCLDVRDGIVVKGVQFRDHREIGGIVELAKRYESQGADELVLYDIGASADKASVALTWIEAVARELSIPFCVAGGIDSLAKARAALNAGADKISINSPALARPELINELSENLGAQCIVIGIDAWREEDGRLSAKRLTGRESTTVDAGREVLAWVDEVQERGAGEIVLNVMRRDGMKSGYDIESLSAVRERASVPVIASGGAGSPSDIVAVFQEANVDGALAASIFHDGLCTIGKVHQAMRDAAIPTRSPFRPSEA